MCAYICVFVYLCVHLRICAYICVFVATFAYVCIHTCVFVCTFAYLCAHPARGQPHPYHSVPGWSSAVSRTPHSLHRPLLISNPFSRLNIFPSILFSHLSIFTPLTVKNPLARPKKFISAFSQFVCVSHIPELGLQSCCKICRF